MSKIEETDHGDAPADADTVSDLPAAPMTFKMVKDLGGNPRSTSISHFPKEVGQAVLDVSSYLQEHAPSDNLAEIPGLSADRLVELQSALGVTLPHVVQTLFLTHNGGIRIYDFVCMNDEQVLKTVGEHKDHAGWPVGFVPLARDLDETLLGVLTKGLSGEGKGDEEESKSLGPSAWDQSARLAEWSSDDGLQVADYADVTPATFFERYRNKLLSHKFEFVEDVGLVERLPSPTKPSRGKK